MTDATFSSPDRERTEPRFDAPARRYLALIAAAASIGAAVIHFAVMGEHWEEWWLYGAFFSVCAWAQLAFAPLVLRGRPDWLLRAAAAGQLAVVVLWVVTRTTGLPFGPDAGQSEAAGLPDVLSTVLELLAAGGALALTVPRVARARVSREWAAGVIALVVSAVAATATLSLTPAYAEHHGAGMTMADGTVMAADGHTHSAATTEAATTSTTTSTTTGTGASGDMHMNMSATSGVDCHHAHDGMVGHAQGNCTNAAVTAAQQAAADSLVQATVKATAKWPTLGDAYKAGYRIDNVSGPIYHVGNLAWQKDSDVLNPDHPENLVYAKFGNRSMLMGAMYVMPKVTDQGPLIGGALTSWHIHTALCVDATTYTALNPRADGTCAPSSKVAPTPQMLHVWVVPYPGGPFAEIDAPGVTATLKAQFRSKAQIDNVPDPAT